MSKIESITCIEALAITTESKITRHPGPSRPAQLPLSGNYNVTSIQFNGPFTLLANHRFCLILTIVGAQFFSFATTAAVAADTITTFDKRGHQVEQRYQDFSDRLAVAFGKLRKMVARDAANLLPRLDIRPPQRRNYGYQILPRIVGPSATCVPTPIASNRSVYRPRSSRFSWPITERRINDQLERIESDLELAVAEIDRLTPDTRIKILARSVADYEEIRDQHRLIDQWIQHNWLWQREISTRKTQYQQATVLHDAIVEHQALQDALVKKNESDYRLALRQTRYADSPLARRELDPQLKLNMAELATQIRVSAQGLRPRDYVKLQHPTAQLTVIKVPVYTDIDDKAYLQQLAHAIETHWCLDDSRHRFRLQIAFVYRSTATLYVADQVSNTSNNGINLPKNGDAIDLVAHCRRFPNDGAILTSGANKTYVRASCLYLGPEDVTPGHLAHEFGHLLGFGDEYVRGYRDLGEDGYEILEILPNDADIMASSRHGSVQHQHFDALQSGANYRRLYLQGIASMSTEKYVDAINIYRQAIKAAYNDAMAVDALNNLGWSLTQLKRYREAIVIYQKALRVRPNYDRARNNLILARKLLKSGETARDF